MSKLTLTVLSLRYSSWSMRPWLALYHTGVPFDTETVSLPHMARQAEATTLGERRKLGSVRGLFPVLRVDGTPIHESLAICEYVADAFPDANLWPADSLQRAAARAICSEMVSGFSSMRNELSCHLFGRFLFGRFSIADAMYFPVLTRFRTYAVALPSTLVPYAEALEAHPAVQALVTVAASAPHIPVYDDYLRRCGGDPDAVLHKK